MSPRLLQNNIEKTGYSVDAQQLETKLLNPNLNQSSYSSPNK